MRFCRDVFFCLFECHVQPLGAGPLFVIHELFVFGVNDCYRNFEAQKKQNACQQIGFFAAQGRAAQAG
jgi:hypothetical protein